MGGEDGFEGRLDAVRTLLSECSFRWSGKFVGEKSGKIKKPISVATIIELFMLLLSL